VSPEAISAMLENLNKAPHEPGASTIEQYKDLIKNVIKQAQRTELRDMIREEIHNNHT
jgi:hypothetical protein